jgi:ATP-dependent helicase/nuclease subunit A
MWRVPVEKPVQSPPYELIDVVVRAGAGAGKTTELTKRVLTLAENFYSKHQKYPHFVVTTFTRKATQELKERLLKQAMEKKDAGLIHFVKRPSQLQISTIHGVLSLYLSRYGSVMGLSPRLSMISESRERSLLKRLLRELCQNDDKFNLNFQILVENAEFSDLLSAFQDYFRLKLQFSEMTSFCKKDFQGVLVKKSAQLSEHLQELAASIREETSNEKWLELAAFCEAQRLGANDTSSFWHKVLENWPSVRKNKETSEELLELRDYVKKELEYFSNWRASEDYFQTHDSFCQLFEYCGNKVSDKLKETKLFTGEVTMQDLETLSLWMIRQHPETAEAFSKNWDYWLIDEYQDTSPSQVELLKALSGQSSSFVVGDPQQSIYLFRGARSEVFQMREDQTREKGVLHSMLTNYRSRPELLEFFNHLFAGLGKQFQRMAPKSMEFNSVERPAGEILVVSKDPESQNNVELEAVLFRCQELNRQGVPFEQICVLSRNNRDLEELAWIAKDLGLPVQVHSSGKFFERREIADALSLLKFLCNPHDNKNLLQLLRSPIFKIEDQLLYEWSSDISSSQSHWLAFAKKSHSILSQLQEMLLQIHEQGIGQVWKETLVQKGYFQFVHLMDPSGRREANLWKLIQMICSEERRPGFSYLDFLKNLDLKSLSTEDQDEADAVPVVEPQKVHLMTVHASKGLQFPHVILPKMGKTAPPPSVEFFLSDETSGRWTLGVTEPEEGKKVASLSGLSLLEVMKKRQQEEEDRVLYVALTRAEESVTLIYEEEPRDSSWAARLPLKQEEGSHREEKFTYRLRKQAFKAEKALEVIQKALEEIQPYQARVSSSLQTYSVTEIIESENKKSVAVVKREMADLHKALAGVDVHRIFESIKYKWMKDPEFQWQDLMPQLSDPHQAALRYLAEDQNGRWLEVIQNGEVEFGLAVKLDQRLIQGQIDLWGFDHSGQAWVVDYKTGSSEHQAKAMKQLHIYCWALQKMKKIDPEKPVQLAVIYPFSNLTLIEKAPSLLEIEKQIRSIP